MSNSATPMDCSMPGLPVLHCLLEFDQVLVHWISDAIQPSHPLLPASSFAISLSQCQGLCIRWQLFASGGQSIGASASVLPMNIQGWFPLGLTGLISLLSNGLSRVSRVLCDAKCFICWFYPHILIYLPLKPQFGSLLMVQWLRLWAPHAEDVGSTANQGTKILHAAQCGQINKYNFKNK